jgi:hypothetical protein
MWGIIVILIVLVLIVIVLVLVLIVILLRVIGIWCSLGVIMATFGFCPILPLWSPRMRKVLG